MAGPDSEDIRSKLTPIFDFVVHQPPNHGPSPDVGIVLFVVALLVTSYRCFARYTKKLWWHDDSVALFSALSFVFFAIGPYNVCSRSPRRQSGTDNSVVLGFTLIADGMGPHVWLTNVFHRANRSWFQNHPHKLERSLVVISSLWVITRPFGQIIRSPHPGH